MTKNHFNSVDNVVSASFQLGERTVECLTKAIQVKSGNSVNFFGDLSTQALRECLLTFEDSFLPISRYMMQQVDRAQYTTNKLSSVSA